MKIRAKLIVLIVGIVIFLSAAAALYLFMNAVSVRMETEKSYLSALTVAIQDHALTMNRIPSTPFREKLDKLDEKAKILDQAFQNINRIVVIAQLNADLNKAIGVIKDLKNLSDSRLATFIEKYNVVAEDSKILFTFPDNQKIMDYYTYEFRGDKATYMAEQGAVHLKAFMDDLDIMNDSIQTTTQVIGEQNALIDTEVAAAQVRAIQISGLVVALIIALTLVISLFFASSIAGGIIKIERSISRLKDGDLTARTDVKSQDEIGILSRNLNQFTESLSSAFRQITQVSGSNVVMKDELIDSTNEAMSAVTEIEANTGSIGTQIHELDQRIDQSIDSIGRILGGITALNDEIAGQNAMTEQSTASVTQMLASLEQMSTTTNRDRQSVADLVRVSEHGRVVFEQSNTRIAEIPEHIGTIRDMATVIKTIAAQTNLLAMNAAIEAAHAGDAGRGFAVVAAEIRKLSEASTTSSRDISTSIKSIVAVIEKASMANAETSEAFKAIESRIGTVAHSMDEMFQAISEIQVGSKQILSAMVDLRERSAHVNDGAHAMDEATAEIKLALGDLSRISSEVTSNITEITVGINAIGTVIRTVAQLSDNVGTESARLDAEVHRFRIE